METAVEEAVIAKAATLNSVYASAMKEAGYKHDLASAELQAQVDALRKEMLSWLLSCLLPVLTCLLNVMHVFKLLPVKHSVKALL